MAWLWLIPAVPAVGAALGRVFPRFQRILAIGAPAGAFAVAGAAIGAVVAGPEHRLVEHLWRAGEAGGVRLDVALSADLPSLVLALAVAALAGRAQLRAGSARIGLLAGATLVVILADDLALMLAGWEAAGLFGWALVSGLPKGNKAFVVDRLGAVGVLCAIALLLGSSWVAPTLRISELHDRFALHAAQGGGAPHWASLACALLFVGAAAKATPAPALGWIPACSSAALLTKLWFVFDVSPRGPTMVACGAAAIGAVAIWVASRTLSKLALGAAARVAAFDRVVVDGTASAAAALVRYLSALHAAVDVYVVDGVVHLAAEGALRVGRALRRAQSGDPLRYLFVAIAGALLVIAAQVWLR